MPSSSSTPPPLDPPQDNPQYAGYIRRSSNGSTYNRRSSNASTSSYQTNTSTASNNNDPSPPIVTSHAFITDETHGWIPCEILSQSTTSAIVLPLPPKPVEPVSIQDIHQDENVDLHPNVDFTGRDSYKATPYKNGGNVIPAGGGSVVIVGKDSRGQVNIVLKKKEDLQEEEENKSGENAGFITPKKLSKKGNNSDRIQIVVDDGTANPPRIEMDAISPLARKALELDLDLESGPNDSPQQTTQSRTIDLKNAITISLSSYPQKTLPLMEVSPESGTMVTHMDMCNMAYLHEASILYNLKERYEGVDGVPYTRTGDIVVAINPYRWIKGLYAQAAREFYAEQLVWRANPRARTQLPPHLYEASSLAFKGLIMDAQDQSILVSGESGAGKTVAVKILMSHLATFHESRKKYNEELEQNGGENGGNGSDDCQFGILGTLVDWVVRSITGVSIRGGEERNALGVQEEKIDLEAPPPEPDDEPEEMQQTNLIVKRVLDSNPLLEAFGNAKTCRNDNSSRFSKYVKLQFHMEYLSRAFPSCHIAGSRCETYLLEKSRVVRHASGVGERTFHIFYQLLAAPEDFKGRIWSGLVGTDASSFKYVGRSDTDTIEGLTDAQRWRRTIFALDILGVRGDALMTLLRALCAVLQLGNLTFAVDSANDDASVIDSKDELEKLSDIIGIPSDDIVHALTHRSVTVAADNTTYQVPMTTEHAKETCDAFAKEIYSRVFDWLVGAINDATCAEKNFEKSAGGRFGNIGLLDIFGFECFELNQFEQLCINHANERLQQKFTSDIFCTVKEEYDAEGIVLREIPFEDNSKILKLLEKKCGIIDLLNEECFRPRGSDAGFVNKVYAHNKDPDTPLFKHRSYQRHEFAVHHYAGIVKYDASMIVAKNMDKLSDDVVDCGLKSTNDLIRSGIQARKGDKPEKKKGSLITNTVWTKFKMQLNSLMDCIGQTKTRYVRCINPNKDKSPGVLDLKYSVFQLRCAGIVSAVTMSRSAFPNRLTYPHVLERFRFLAEYGIQKKKSYFLDAMKTAERKEKEDVKALLDYLLEPLEVVSSSGVVKKAFVCGKTRVYFRAGALEHLESERLTAYDRFATKIQSRIRMNSAMQRYSVMLKNPPKQVKRRDNMVGAILLQLQPFLPLPLLMWRQVVSFPSWILGHPFRRRNQERRD